MCRIGKELVTGSALRLVDIQAFRTGMDCTDSRLFGIQERISTVLVEIETTVSD